MPCGATRKCQKRILVGVLCSQSPSFNGLTMLPVCIQVIVNEGHQNDVVQKTFAGTSIGKNIMHLDRCHVTIEKYYDEMLSCVQQIEEKIKRQTNISMVIQDGVKLFKDNLKKLKTVKGMQSREVLAIEIELKQYISVEAKVAHPTKKRARELLEEEAGSGKHTPSKKSARG